MLSKFFIERPVLANVIALLMMLLGGVAIVTLPVAQFPADSVPKHAPIGKLLNVNQ